jgi:serine/threonine-protein kinase HipA
MADREVEVWVQIAGEDVHAGRIWSHRHGNVESATFAYASAYLRRSDAYALDPALPLFSGQHQTPSNREIFGAFSDCSPDRWGKMLIKRCYDKQDGRDGDVSFGEIDYLLGVRDDLRQGALRFRDPSAGEFLASEDEGVPHLVDLPRLLDLSDRAEEDVASNEELEILLKGGSSLGGARPKAHVIDGEGRIAIAKFPKPEGDEWDVTRWEGVAQRLARRSGINTPGSELHEISGRWVLIVDRFDRGGDVRVGYVSAMTMLEAVDGEGASYLDLVEVIEEESDRASEDLIELWRRVAFSILVTNTDDHLRNHGFLRSTSGGWSLSPAFDINPNPDPGPRLMSTSINGSSYEANIAALLEVAEFFRLSDRKAREILDEVVGATIGWRPVAAQVGMRKGDIDRMESAFEHAQAEIAREIVGKVGAAR